MHARQSVIGKIENIFCKMVDALQKNEAKQLAITMRIRKSAADARLGPLDVDKAKPTESKTRRLCFPGKSEEEAWRFSMQVLRLPETIR